MDYQEITADGVFLHHYISDLLPEAGGTEDVTYEPPLVILRFPLEVGATWSADSMRGDQEVSFDYEVVGQESISTPGGDFEGCYRVVRSSGGMNTSNRCTVRGRASPATRF